MEALLSYIKAGCIDLKEELPVYRAINSAKNAKTPLQRRDLRYKRVRELVLECSIDFPKVNIGVHSLRAGGASAAANEGVKDGLFKRHGRCVSENAKDGYVREDSQIDFSTHNVKWTLWGWGVLGVDVID